MSTFAFIVLTYITAPGAQLQTEEAVIDRSLTVTDCAALTASYAPSEQTLPNGVTLATRAECRSE